MPSTYSDRSSLELQAAGENLNVWGDPKLNNNFKKIDFAVKGVVSFALSGPITLTSSTTSTDPADIQSVAASLNITGGTGGTITVPSRQGTWTVRNASSGSVTLTTGAGALAVIASGDVASVICDGTNVYRELHADFGGQRLKNVGTPTQTTDAATKQYVDNAAFSSALPAQAGNGGKFLGTDGTNASWQTVLPAFSGTTDYILSSNGSNAVWSTPAQIRAKLSLGGSALLNVGTTGGTVAAGDDGRFASIASIANAAMPKAGGTFTGQIDVPQINVTGFGIVATNSPSNGSVNLRSSGDGVTTGFQEFFTGATRRGYIGGIGFGNNIVIYAENGWGIYLNQRPSFAGQTPYDTGNITFGTAAPGTLPVGAIYLRYVA